MAHLRDGPHCVPECEIPPPASPRRRCLLSQYYALQVKALDEERAEEERQSLACALDVLAMEAKSNTGEARVRQGAQEGGGGASATGPLPPAFTDEQIAQQAALLVSDSSWTYICGRYLAPRSGSLDLGCLPICRCYKWCVLDCTVWFCRMQRTTTNHLRAACWV